MSGLIVVGVLSATSAGCGPDDDDPLGRETLLGIAESYGNAEGSTFAGTFAGGFQAESCVCDRLDVEGATPVQVCTLISQPLSGLGGFVLHQADGFLSVRVASMQLTGAVDSSGEIRVASVAVANLSGLLVETRARFDGSVGSFTTSLPLVGVWQQRGLSRINGDLVDCTATYVIDAVRIDD